MVNQQLEADFHGWVLGFAELLTHHIGHHHGCQTTLIPPRFHFQLLFLVVALVCATGSVSGGARGSTNEPSRVVISK